MKIVPVLLIVLLLSGGLVYFMKSGPARQVANKEKKAEGVIYKDLQNQIRSSNPQQSLGGIEKAIALNNPEGFRVLEKAASKPDPVLRLALIAVCKRIPKRSAGQIIAEVLTDTNPSVQNQAVKELETLSGKTYGLSTSTSSQDREQIMRQAKADALALN